MSGTPLRGIVGHHKNAGTWLKGYGEAEPSPLSLKLRLRLRADTWATLVRASSSSRNMLQEVSKFCWPQGTSPVKSLVQEPCHLRGVDSKVAS